MTTNPPSRNGGRWTEARYRSFITSALRAAFRRWPPKFDVLKSAFIDKRINKKTGKLASHYRCAKCRKAFPATGVQVDHTKPVVNTRDGFVTWDTFINNLYCEEDNLQVMCKACHKLKTAEERKERNESSKPVSTVGKRNSKRMGQCS